MNVQAIAVNQALKLLKAAGAQYAVLLPDGTLVQEGHPLGAPKKERQKKVWKNKGISEYVTEHLKGLTPDPGSNQTVIPCTGAFSKQSIQASAAASAHKLWGSGGYITHKNDAGVEVLRIA